MTFPVETMEAVSAEGINHHCQSSSRQGETQMFANRNENLLLVDP